MYQNQINKFKFIYSGVYNYVESSPHNIGKYTTTVYHKPTFTGVYLNWTSLTARRYKIGLIKCLTKRILLICSDENARESHLKKLKQLLLRNQYPSEVIEREINICLEKYSSNNKIKDGC